MDKISVKEYAHSRGVSPEIVRRQIIRYEKELEGHLTPKGKTKLLDRDAVAFLDEHRSQKSITIEPTETETQMLIEGLRKINEDLQNKLLETQKQMIELQEKHITLIEEKSRYQGMLEEKERTQQLTDREIQELRSEVSSFQKSLFGFWRKKKS